jgi:hypothetical protein
LIHTAYGGPTGWEYIEFDLSAYSGIIDVTIEYFSRSSITDRPGWYIDDLSFLGCTFIGNECRYTVGDMNGDGDLTGLDVSFGVNYFKGGPAPTYTCMCPPHGSWYVAGDVNANCVYNGVDITYLVAYFKGSSAPAPCPDCPPVLDDVSGFKQMDNSTINNFKKTGKNNNTETLKK